MENENKKILLKRFGKSKSNLILTIVFIAIAIFLLAIGVIINHRTLPQGKELDDVTKENEYVQCKILDMTDCFADYSVDGSVRDEYYMATDGNYVFILNLSKSQYRDLEKQVSSLDENSEGITICGMSEKISADLKKIAIDTYNEMYDEELLNYSNFDTYFTPYYINVKKTPNDSGNMFITFGAISGFVGEIFLLCFVILYFRTRSSINKFAQKNDLAEFMLEIDDPTNLTFEKTKTIFTKNYIVNYTNALTIINYKDIVWIYPIDYRRNGIKYASRISITTKDKKSKLISEITSFGKENQKQFEDTYMEIINRKPIILAGSTPENIKAMNKKNIDQTIANMELKESNLVE